MEVIDELTCRVRLGGLLTGHYGSSIMVTLQKVEATGQPSTTNLSVRAL